MKLLLKRRGEENVVEIPVISFSDLGSAGSIDDDDDNKHTKPRPIVPVPVRRSGGTAFCAGESSSPTHAFGVAGLTGGRMDFCDPGKMARVVAWLNSSADEHSSDENNADRVTPSDFDNKNEESDVQISKTDFFSSVPWPPSALSDDDEDQPALPLMENEDFFLMAHLEESSHRLFSMNSVRRVLGIRQRATCRGSLNRRANRR